MSDNFTMKQPQQLTEEIIQDDIIYWRKSEMAVPRAIALFLCAFVLLILSGNQAPFETDSIIFLAICSLLALLCAFDWLSQKAKMSHPTAYTIVSDVVVGKSIESVDSESPDFKLVFLLGSGTEFSVSSGYFTRQNITGNQGANAIDVGTELYLLIDNETKNIMHIYLADRWMLPQ